MIDAFMRALADTRGGRALEQYETEEVAGKGSKDVSAGVLFTPSRDDFPSVLKSTWGVLMSKLKKTPKKLRRQHHFGNCLGGYSLEFMGEDADYFVLVCVPQRCCWYLLAKKKAEDASNGGFGKDKTLDQIVDGNKYDT